MSDLTAVTTYGRGQAGARVRVFEWIDRLMPGSVVYSYLGTSLNSPKTLLTRPRATLAAERSVRRLANQKQRTLLIFRQAGPFGHGGLEARLLRSAECGVYDFDDGLFGDVGRRSDLGGLIRSSAAKCTRAVKNAHRVIAGNDYLAEWAGQFARDVVVIPSCVDPEIYRVKVNYDLSDPPRLVWIGSPMGENYLRFIEGALLRLHRESGARLTIIGDLNARLESPLEKMTDRIQWREGRAEQQLAEFDIGLGPLTDDPFSRGKSAYKLLQYGAAGLPFLASPVGANHAVTKALGGSPAAVEAEWIDQLTEMFKAPISRRQFEGERARKAVVGSYSFDSWQDRWLTALELASGERATRTSRRT